MSLSSFLLNSAKNVDAELDSLFKSTPVPIPTPGTAKASKNAQKKRKVDADKEAEDESTPSSAKRAKSSPVKKARESAKKAGKAKGAEKKEKESKKAKVEDDNPKVKEGKKGKVNEDKHKVKEGNSKVEDTKKTEKKGKSKQVEADSDEEDENADLEDAYLQKSATAKDTPKSAKDDDTNEDSDEELDLSNLVHETISGKGKKSKAKVVKFAPEDETPEQKDQRTVFVGNLPLEVAQKRPLLKQLQKHFLTLIPNAKIESTRLRSVPFQTPTAKLPTSDDEGDAPAGKKPTTGANSTTPRQHDLERTSAWRIHAKDDEDENKDEKKFLSKSQKKKIAFINHEFHTSADSVNAYIVFAHPVPAELQQRAANVPPAKEIMDPYEAAREAVEKGGGTLFMERLIRVDMVGKSDGKENAEKKPTGVEPDPKLSIFVGNLDFASKEEDLRVFFEGVVSAELGPPPVGDAKEEGEGVKKPKSWVTRVRIVRDRDTQLGKGFAYIQFAERECVDEILSLEEDKLKFAKRKLRVEKCKTLPGATNKISLSSTPKSNPADPKSKVPTQHRQKIEVPKGDPALGEKLASLSKDERKQVKAADADRVARRLAKKKARMAMGTKANDGKERKRDRKDKNVVKDRRNTGKKEGGRRVRSERSEAKRNGRK